MSALTSANLKIPRITKKVSNAETSKGEERRPITPYTQDKATTTQDGTFVLLALDRAYAGNIMLYPPSIVCSAASVAEKRKFYGCECERFEVS